MVTGFIAVHVFFLISFVSGLFAQGHVLIKGQCKNEEQIKTEAA